MICCGHLGETLRRVPAAHNQGVVQSRDLEVTISPMAWPQKTRTQLSELGWILRVVRCNEGWWRCSEQELSSAIPLLGIKGLSAILPTSFLRCL